MSDEFHAAMNRATLVVTILLAVEVVMFRPGEGPMFAMLDAMLLLNEALVGVFLDAVVPALALLFSALLLYAGALLIGRGIASPYPLASFGVRWRNLPLEAVELGEHDAASCLSCDREEGPGVRRGYVEEFVVLGVPVREDHRSETYDCASHTDADGFDALDALDAEDRDALDLALDLASEDSDAEDQPEEASA